MGTSGYKSNVTGFSIGTQFEYFDDFKFDYLQNTFEKISVDNNASAKQKKQDEYFDSFIGLNFFTIKEIKNFKQLVVFLVIITLIYQF